MKIAIIIPVHNRKACIESILNQIYAQTSQENYSENITVVVVDDGSTDGTKELIQDSFPTAHIVLGDGSLWWTGAIVKGMEYAVTNLNADYIVWLNDDIFLADDFVSNLASICESSQYRETIVGGIVRDKTYSDWIVYSGVKNGQPIRNISCFSASTELDMDTLAGNIIVIPRAVIEKIGMPDATKFPHNGGDYEFMRVARQNGIRIVSHSKLQAVSDFTVADLIRYMPYWMQWFLQTNPSKRRELVKGLKTLKSNQNIWLFVNIKNRDAKHIPQWKYTLCFLDKRLKLFLIDFLPPNYVKQKIYQYFSSWSVPKEIADLVMLQRNPK